MSRTMMGKHPHQGREYDLPEMEADRTGGVERLVQVMHLVETPEERPLVVRPVPPVEPQVEQEDIDKETWRT